jgi:hypothetical protein
MPLPLLEVAKNTGRQKKILAANEVRQHAPPGSQVIFVVPMEFPMEFPTCSPSLQCVPQHVPNTTSMYSISFALCSTLVTYISSSKEEIRTYLFWDCPKHNDFTCKLGIGKLLYMNLRPKLMYKEILFIFLSLLNPMSKHKLTSCAKKRAM